MPPTRKVVTIPYERALGLLKHDSISFEARDRIATAYLDATKKYVPYLVAHVHDVDKRQIDAILGQIENPAKLDAN